MRTYFRILFLFLFLIGCGPVYPPVEWYTGGPVEPVDVSGLVNKVIVLDPGHGGRYKGAVGKQGMTEADVNLRVCLKLLKMLDSAGAQPILTRLTDRDFIPASDNAPSVRKDLTERMARTNLCRPDLFVSLHHNASSKKNTDMNSTKTFYAMHDDGLSLNAANAIHQKLVKHLKINKGYVIPGNYFVLRNSRAPAVLGEPSYLSNPQQEIILRNDSAISVEARAYFEGIAAYFSRDIPVIEEMQPSGKVLRERQPLLWARINGSANEPEASGMVDGKELMGSVNEEGLASFRPQDPLKNGWHTFSVIVQGPGRYAEIESVCRFKISMKPHHFSLTHSPPAAHGKKGRLIKITASVFDSSNNPVADSTYVSFSSDAGKWKTDSAITFNGVAANYLHIKRTGPVTVTVRCGTIEDSLPVENPKEDRYFCGFLLDDKTDSVLQDAGIISEDGVPAAHSDNGGFFHIRKEVFPASIRKRGYVPKLLRDHVPENIRMQPVDDGVLRNVKIMIDPEYGGEEPGPLGKNGIRAADLNMEFAEMLAYYLKLAGADIYFSRRGNKTMTPYQRVEASIREQPAVFISIGYDSVPGNRITFQHYPSSTGGKSICKNLRKTVKKIVRERKTGKYSALVNIVLQQTPCPAVRISPASVHMPDTSFAGDRTLAYSCYRGLVNYFSERPDKNFSKFRLPENFKRTANRTLLLDEYLSLSIPKSGTIILHGLFAGPHTMKVLAGRKLILQDEFIIEKNGRLKF